MVGQEILDRFPDILPREDESIFRRYVEAHQEEMDEEYDTAIESVKLSRQIEHVSGENLDRIGRIFGPIGRRTGRADEQYRRYLKSVVQAFSGRGTDRSMREALAAALDISVEDVRLTEDFENVEYEVILHDWTPHSVNNIYEIAEIVDPSGVKQSNLRYSIPDADLQGVDEAVATDGLQVVADGFATSVDTVVQIRLQETFDESQSSDDVSAFDNDREATDTSNSSVSHTDEVYVVVHSEARWDKLLWDEASWDEKYPFERTALHALVEETVTTDAGIDTSSSAVISEEDVEQIVADVTEHFDDVTTEIDDGTTETSESSSTTTQVIDDEFTEDTHLVEIVTEDVISNIDETGLSVVTLLEQIVEDNVPETDEASDLVEENITDNGTIVGSSSTDETTTDTATVLWDDGDWDSMRFA